MYENEFQWFLYKAWNEPGNSISCKISWALSEDSDQPTHSRSLNQSLRDTLWVATVPKRLQGGSKDTDQVARMRELIWIIVGCTCNHAGNAVPRLISLERYLCSQQMWAVPTKHVSASICGQQRARSTCSSAQSGQGLHFPQTESLDTTECMNGHYENTPIQIHWKIYQQKWQFFT